MSHGHFTAYVNAKALTAGPEEGRLIQSIRETAAPLLGPGDVRWTGSLFKGTAIVGSDLDVWVDSAKAVTPALRRPFAEALGSRLLRPVSVQSHVVRVAADSAQPRVDVSFAKATFGARPAPDDQGFRSRPDRQQAARALKIWARAGGLPRVPGWVVEAFVLGADRQEKPLDGLGLFVKLLKWLADSATLSSVESILRPAAAPAWKPEWSRPLVGRIEAVRNAARATLARDLTLRPLRNASDVDDWLRPPRR